jgi:hypothetical protein
MPGEVEHQAPFRILPPHPELTGLPLRANLGEQDQVFVLSGQGLDRIRSLDCDRAQLRMNGGGEVHLTLAPDVQKGERLDLELAVEGVNAPVPVEAAIEVVGPRPNINGSRVSLPDELGIELRNGELPTGSFASFSLQIGPLDSEPQLDLSCSDESLTLQATQAVAGQQSAGLRVRDAGPGTLFLSFDPGAIGRAGCELRVTISTPDQGASEPFPLGKIVRLPAINQFDLTAELAGPEQYFATVEGEDLELIERVGWDAFNGVPVESLPVPVAAGGHRQTLRIALPWPSPAPHAPLYVWLRGEESGRATTARF